MRVVFLFSLFKKMNDKGLPNSLGLTPTFQVHSMALGQVENIVPDSAAHRNPLA